MPPPSLPPHPPGKAPTPPPAPSPTPTVPESRRGAAAAPRRTVLVNPVGTDYHWTPLDPGGATRGENLIWRVISGRSRPDLARRLVVLRLKQQRVGHQYEQPAEGAALSLQGAVALGEQLAGAAAAEQRVRLRGKVEERSRKVAEGGAGPRQQQLAHPAHDDVSEPVGGREAGAVWRRREEQRVRLADGACARAVGRGGGCLRWRPCGGGAGAAVRWRSRALARPCAGEIVHW